jgi:endonuclease YncB( thermonuclease family)
MLAYPYDPPRVGEPGVKEVLLIQAASGDLIDARSVDGNAEFQILVANVAAPLKQQPWHSEAKSFLDALVRGKRAWIKVYETLEVPDGLDIEVANVHVDGRDISWELVGNGNAWVWEKKNNDSELTKLQAWARERKKGFWALPESDREPPWVYIDRTMRERMQKRENPESN